MGMTVADSSMRVLESAAVAEQIMARTQVSLLKKAQDVETETGEALIQMLESTGTKAILDTYA